MGTLLAEFKAAERALAMQYRAFEEMKQNPEFKKALEFETALDEFLAKHKMSRPALYELLSFDVEPDSKAVAKAAAKSAPKDDPNRVKRSYVRKTHYPLRTYKNPHTGEELQIRMATNATYTAWVAQYGKDVVASWLIHTEGE